MTNAAAPVGDPLPTQDPVGVFFTSVLSQLIAGAAPDAISNAAEGAYPFLAFPVVKQIFEFAVQFLATKISVVTQEGVLKIVFKVERDSAEYSMVAALVKLADAHESGDQDAIDKSLQDAVDEWERTIHFGGVAPIIGG